MLNTCHTAPCSATFELRAANEQRNQPPLDGLFVAPLDPNRSRTPQPAQARARPSIGSITTLDRTI